MKLTKGNFCIGILVVISLISSIWYFYIHGNPFIAPDDASYLAWAVSTALFMIIYVALPVYKVVDYLIDHWDEPLFKKK